MPGELNLPFDTPPPAIKTAGAGSLASKFVMAPFSVLNGQTGVWLDRKRAWINLGIKSELGRDVKPYHISSDGGGYTGKFSESHAAQDLVASIFDPVLCELVYTWFTPPGATVYDPFAGGSVRGVIAGMCGRNYLGVDLRAEQVDANIEQWEHLSTAQAAYGSVRWITGDSRDSLLHLNGKPDVDMVFSCPPYFDLEVYSDDPRDLSRAGTYEEFLASMRLIVAECVYRLKDNRFACFVVGDIRDPGGNYRNLPGDTIRAFTDAGLRLYNDAVLVTPVGSLALRVPGQMAKTRKLGMSHQRVLVFLKGNTEDVREEFGEIPQGMLA